MFSPESLILFDFYCWKLTRKRCGYENRSHFFSAHLFFSSFSSPSSSTYKHEEEIIRYDERAIHIFVCWSVDLIPLIVSKKVNKQSKDVKRKRENFFRVEKKTDHKMNSKINHHEIIMISWWKCFFFFYLYYHHYLCWFFLILFVHFFYRYFNSILICIRRASYWPIVIVIYINDELIERQVHTLITY